MHRLLQQDAGYWSSCVHQAAITNSCQCCRTPAHSHKQSPHVLMLQQGITANRMARYIRDTYLRTTDRPLYTAAHQLPLVNLARQANIQVYSP